MPKTTNVNSFDEQNTNDAAGKGNKKRKRRFNPFRGVANFLNEEAAATRGDYDTLRRLKRNPKY